MDPGSLPPVPPPVRATLGETAPLENLDSVHLEAFNLALSNLLHTEVAEYTLAQIVDGLPTRLSFSQSHRWSPLDHPALSHENICSGALEKTLQARADLNIQSLRFNPALLEHFQDEPRESRGFHLRLIEMLAVACHQIAAYLFQLDEENEHKKAYEAWFPEAQQRKAAGDERYVYYDDQPPTAFYHRSYCDYEQYPRGVPDVVGYWAETKIFGGVVLFDRGKSETECNEIWFDPCHHPGPTTMYSPTPEQFNDLINFLQSDAQGATVCPLPIRASNLNRPRYYRYHATKYFHIFRDKYDSRLPAWFVHPGGCVQSPIDFPEIEDQNRIFLQTMRVTGNGGPQDETAILAAVERLKNITPSSPLWPIEDTRFR
ncbi:hypothetical protein F5Y16DRAFT_359527 [Xylariaceae sp. FL0255]|nr:hypothetical protein F5Y16DRAFT_359527 [Xylariaceae sp. FL0255]